MPVRLFVDTLPPVCLHDTTKLVSGVPGGSGVHGGSGGYVGYKGGHGYIQVWAVRSEMTNAQHDTLDEPFFSAMDETYVPPRIQNLVASRMPCKQ